MKTHSRFEFVMEEEPNDSFSGNSVEEVFNAMTEGVLGISVKTKVRTLFDRYGVINEVPELTIDRNEFYEKFFEILQTNVIGTWKWYDSLANEKHWRYSAQKNDYVRRVGKGKWVRSPEVLAKIKANLEISHERRRQNPELAHRISVLAHAASEKVHRNMSPETRKYITSKMREGVIRRFANMTDEERKEYGRQKSESMKAYYQRKREAIMRNAANETGDSNEKE